MKLRTEKFPRVRLCAVLLAALAGCAVRQKAADVATQPAPAPASTPATPTAIQAAPAATGQAVPGSPQPRPQPLVSYLKDGSLWVTREDGGEQRQLVAAPPDRAINYHVWSRDGSRIYFNVGLELYAFDFKEQKAQALAVLPLPPTATLDRLEAGREPGELIARTVDANDTLNTPPRVFALKAGQGAPAELSVDEYQAMAPPQSAVIHSVGEMSVAPDGKALLFWEVVGADEQLFVADIETGARLQVTDLSLLDGFDATASPDGVKRLIEATWSPDGEHIVFIPAQSCSEAGFCFGRLYVVSRWGGPAHQLAADMVTNLAAEWNRAGTKLVYDDQGQVLIADTHGQIRPLAEGNQPRWQPTL
jgi:hypothetical protein